MSSQHALIRPSNSAIERSAAAAARGAFDASIKRLNRGGTLDETGSNVTAHTGRRQIGWLHYVSVVRDTTSST